MQVTDSRTLTKGSANNYGRGNIAPTTEHLTLSIRRGKGVASGVVEDMQLAKKMWISVQTALVPDMTSLQLLTNITGAMSFLGKL